MSGKTRRHAVAWDGVVIPLHRTESTSIWHSSFTQTNKQIMALHNSFILKSQAVKLRLVAGHSWKSLGNRVQWERVLKKPHGLNDIFIVLQAIFFHHQMVSRRSSSKLPTKCKCQKKKKSKWQCIKTTQSRNPRGNSLSKLWMGHSVVPTATAQTSIQTCYDLPASGRRQWFTRGAEKGVSHLLCLFLRMVKGRSSPTSRWRSGRTFATWKVFVLGVSELIDMLVKERLITSPPLFLFYQEPATCS